MFIDIAIGFIGGMSAVFVFNKIPPKWLTDYGKEPSEELWGKRLKESHFMPLLSILFIWTAHVMRNQEASYKIAGFLAVWLLVLIAISDFKYMIIPDQFTIGLAIVALGMIPYQAQLMSPLYGALAGSGVFYLFGLLGKLLFKKETMGFGDIKLMGAVGMLAGFKGVLIVMFLAIMLAGFVFSALLLSKKIQRHEEKPLGPFIAISAGAFILFQTPLLALAEYFR